MSQNKNTKTNLSLLSLSEGFFYFIDIDENDKFDKKKYKFKGFYDYLNLCIIDKIVELFGGYEKNGERKVISTITIDRKTLISLYVNKNKFENIFLNLFKHIEFEISEPKESEKKYEYKNEKNYVFLSDDLCLKINEINIFLSKDSEFAKLEFNVSHSENEELEKNRKKIFEELEKKPE